MGGDQTRDPKARADALRRRISQRATPAGAEPDAASGPKPGESPLAYTERRAREIAKKTDPPKPPKG